jgi:3,4-dihydroxy 2-butanone 4-phosphate synthase/GTP cyclohydrolase II
VSIEAAEGVTTGISAADRARTVQAAVARNAVASDLVQPGHIFPLQAVDGGVLMRAGHTEAGCDLAAMAGCSPASVICEIMKDDGTMARLPDLQLFAAEHGLKIGTIADLIEHRSRNESLVEKAAAAKWQTAFGEFTAHAFATSPARACTWRWCAASGPRRHVSVRVHEPLSVLDALETNRSMHSWSLDASLKHIATEGKRRRRAAELRRKRRRSCWRSSKAPRAPPGARARPHGPAHLRRGRADPARMRRAQA